MPRVWMLKIAWQKNCSYTLKFTINYIESLQHKKDLSEGALDIIFRSILIRTMIVVRELSITYLTEQSTLLILHLTCHIIVCILPKRWQKYKSW